jgi:DNA-binding LacI/PurR family transcriptional regulator
MITVSKEKKTLLAKSKYELLRNELLGGIVSKRFKPGVPLPSEIELVKQTGLARGTVRQAFEELERQGFICRIRGKGTFIREDARTHNIDPSVQTEKKLAYNFVIPTSRMFVSARNEDMSYMPLYTSIEQVLQTEGFRLSVVYFEEHRQEAVLEDLMRSPGYCDGLVLLTGIVDEKLAAKLVDNTIAHVCIDSRGERLGLNTVCENSVDGIRQALAHLRRLGHTDIAFMGAVHGSRHAFFRAAMAEAEISPAEPVHIDDSSQWFSQEAACRTFGEWLDNKGPATAIICQTDKMALGAIDAMKQRHLSAGREISIVGYDNIEEKDDRFKGEPVLSTIDNSLPIVGRRCGELLLNQVLRGQRQIVHEYLPVVKLIVRQTTGPRC